MAAVDNGELMADCQARFAFDLLANTWNPVIIWALRNGPSRPADLRATIGGISGKVLGETLRRLEYNGLVARQVGGGFPRRVDYSLTPLGQSLVAPIEMLAHWSFDHTAEVLAAQDRADAATANKSQPA